MNSTEPRSQSLQSGDLLASCWMAAGLRPTRDPVSSPYDLPMRAQAAAAAGYRGIGMFYADLINQLAQHGASGIKAILSDHGLVHLELEALTDWYATGERHRNAMLVLQDMLRAAEKIGVRHIKATGSFDGAPLSTERMRESFATAAGMAADSGTRIGLEIVAFSNLRTLPQALAVIGDSIARGGGLMLDCWHFARGALPLEPLAALPVGAIVGVEVSDTVAEIVDDMLTDTLDHRRLCGEGSYPVADFLAAIKTTGYAGPIGVEVLSKDLRARRLDEVMQMSFRTTANALPAEWRGPDAIRGK